jgi:PhnB protein
MTFSHVRNGLGVVRPYVYAHADSVTLVVRAFGGEVVETSPDGGEVAVRVGDSMIAFAIGDSFPPGITTVASVCVYVPDADAAYREALHAGAASVAPPETKPYGERQGAVRDAFGNLWYVATFKG